MINYHDKRFKPVAVSENGQVSDAILFHYLQVGNVVSCIYKGGGIRHGQLIGLVDASGAIDMRYQQVDQDGQLATGVCISKPEFMKDGRVRLHEEWQWTSGDRSKGTSILEEI